MVCHMENYHIQYDLNYNRFNPDEIHITWIKFCTYIQLYYNTLTQLIFLILDITKYTFQHELHITIHLIWSNFYLCLTKCTGFVVRGESPGCRLISTASMLEWLINLLPHHSQGKDGAEIPWEWSFTLGSS